MTGCSDPGWSCSMWPFSMRSRRRAPGSVCGARPGWRVLCWEHIIGEAARVDDRFVQAIAAQQDPIRLTSTGDTG
ncbi:protein of unknown function [Pararobbsia alpina]